MTSPTPSPEAMALARDIIGGVGNIYGAALRIDALRAADARDLLAQCPHALDQKYADEHEEIYGKPLEFPPPRHELDECDYCQWVRDHFANGALGRLLAGIPLSQEPRT